MIPQKYVDPFFFRQPPLRFVEELKKPVHEKKPVFFDRTKAHDDEVCAAGMYLCPDFPDEQGLLETAYADFERFLEVFEIGGAQYPVHIKQGETSCFEEYRIEIVQDGCTIVSADTEGVRRALIWLEDELQRREGPFLAPGEIRRKPWLRTRITRGFFSPTNRPPHNVDELENDIDYYPDEYLNRLAHDGTNGIWIYTRFRELLSSDIFPEYGKNSAKRLAKLQKVVDKCARYGVKVYVFGVEPLALSSEMAAAHPEAVSFEHPWGQYPVCTCTKAGADYCVEATERLFTAVPDLGGLIVITAGERLTACSSINDVTLCPVCGKLGSGAALSHTVDLLQEGMRRAEKKTGKHADFVSWTYSHRVWPHENIRDYVKTAPDDVMLMQNFEDAGFAEQLGVQRQAIDYWLSYTGPSIMFDVTAEQAKKSGKRLFAKMQVCCSHEQATVPYIPVPGILFDKYAAAARWGVEGIMQCWYFGNYPSMMSKAAGELSFTDDLSDKQGFLRHLAATYFGESHAEAAAKAWKLFAKGYENYPLNIMFSYYGPMHDGVIWKLALEPKNLPLSRTWQLQDAPIGDRIGDCLQSGHTLEEAIILCEKMRDAWNEGLALLPEDGPAEQLSNAKALGVLYESGCNILKFYQLRERLGLEKEEPNALLEQLRQLVLDEIENSRKMIPLCKSDSRLGYHSEAEGYKFFPDKLEDRIAYLQALLESEFPMVQERIDAGKAPLRYYLGSEENGYRMNSGEWEKIPESNASFRADYDAENLYLELKGEPETRFVIGFEYRLLWSAPAIELCGEEKILTGCVLSHQSIYGERIERELAKYRVELLESGYRITIPRAEVGWTEDRPLKLRLKADGKLWIPEDLPVNTLGKHEMSPGEYGWLLP